MLKIALNIQFVRNPMRTLLISFLMTLATQAGAGIKLTDVQCKDRIFDKVVGYFNDSPEPVWFINEWSRVRDLPENQIQDWLKANKHRVHDQRYHIDEVYKAYVKRLKEWNKNNEPLKAKYNSPNNKYIMCNIELYVYGRITDEDVKSLRLILQKFSVPPAIHAYLSSEGGNVYAAMEIGRIFRQHFALVDTTAEGCYSACSLIYAAGVSRLNRGKLGLHQHFLDKDFLKSLTVQEAVKFMRNTSKDIQDYFLELGVPLEFYNLAASVPKDELIILGAKEISKIFPFAQPEFAAVIPDKVEEAHEAMSLPILNVARSLKREVDIEYFMEQVDLERAENLQLHLWNRYNSYHFSQARDSQKFYRNR